MKPDYVRYVPPLSGPKCRCKHSIAYHLGDGRCLACDHCKSLLDEEEQNDE